MSTPGINIVKVMHFKTNTQQRRCGLSLWKTMILSLNEICIESMLMWTHLYSVISVMKSSMTVTTLNKSWIEFMEKCKQSNNMILNPCWWGSFHHASLSHRGQGTAPTNTTTVCGWVSILPMETPAGQVIDTWWNRLCMEKGLVVQNICCKHHFLLFPAQIFMINFLQILQTYKLT